MHVLLVPVVLTTLCLFGWILERLLDSINERRIRSRDEFRRQNGLPRWPL